MSSVTVSSVTVAAVPVSSVSVSSVGVAVPPVAVLAVGVAVVRVAVVVRRAAFAAVGVGVAEGADAHQVDQQASNRHRLHGDKTRTLGTSQSAPRTQNSKINKNFKFLPLVQCKEV